MPKLMISKKETANHSPLWVRLGAVFLGFMILSACGSKRDEDLKAQQKDEKEASSPAQIAISVPHSGRDADVNTDPCQTMLTQSYRFANGGIEATFSGAVDRPGCESEDKKPVLYMRMGQASFQPPVELDCQPKGTSGWNVRCVNTSRLFNDRNEVKVIIKADANYRSSQTGMMVTFEKP
jgi:hypothetical protein